jgi:hypothetical protein
MWQAIKYVSSLASLVAFLAAAVVAIVVTQLRKKERLIRLAKGNERADLIKQAINDYGIPVDNIHPADVKELIFVQVKARLEQFRVTIRAILILAALCSIIALFSIYTTARASAGNNTAAATDTTKQGPAPHQIVVAPPVVKNTSKEGKTEKPEAPVSPLLNVLDGASYIDGPTPAITKSDDHLTFAGKGGGNIIGFTGSANDGMYTFSGKMRLSGNTLEVVDGNVSGSLGVYDKGSRLEGPLTIKPSGVIYQVHLQKAP